MNFDQLQTFMLDRGWIAAAALAGIIWRKHEQRDEATAQKVGALSTTVATRDEIVRLHARLEEQDKTVAANHREVMGHLMALARRDEALSLVRQLPQAAEGPK